MTIDTNTVPLTTLAQAIMRDTLRGRQQRDVSPTCFACGRSYSRGHGRFCSTRCRDAFDAGAPAWQPPKAPSYGLPIGHIGFLVDCCGCGEQFDSRGLRCCSTDCERKFRRKQELDAELADDPFRAVKRACLECGGPIANWRNGRRVSKATKFCQPSHQRKAAKNAGGLSGEGQAVLCVQTAKTQPLCQL
jgi:hypothetical protein